MAEIIKKKKKQTKLKADSESEEEDLDFVVADSDDGSRDGDDDLDRVEGKRKRDSSSDEDSSDSDSDSDDDDDIDHVMSKDEVAALKKDQGNVIPCAEAARGIASGIGDASALEAIQKAKPDSDEEAEFEFWRRGTLLAGWRMCVGHRRPPRQTRRRGASASTQRTRPRSAVARRRRRSAVRRRSAGQATRPWAADEVAVPFFGVRRRPRLVRHRRTAAGASAPTERRRGL